MYIIQWVSFAEGCYNMGAKQICPRGRGRWAVALQVAVALCCTVWPRHPTPSSRSQLHLSVVYLVQLCAAAKRHIERSRSKCQVRSGILHTHEPPDGTNARRYGRSGAAGGCCLLCSLSGVSLSCAHMSYWTTDSVYLCTASPALLL